MADRISRVLSVACESSNSVMNDDHTMARAWVSWTLTLVIVLVGQLP